MKRFDSVPYVKYGRTMDGLDCWGLSRLARHLIFDRPLLPVWPGVDPLNPKQITMACSATVAESLVMCEAKPGALAAAFKGSLCVHVGIVLEIDGMLHVLETNAHTGVIRTPIHTFENEFLRVEYYD